MTLENAMFLLSVKCMTTVHVVTQLYMYVTRFGNVTRITVWIIFKKIKSQFCHVISERAINRYRSMTGGEQILTHRAVSAIPALSFSSGSSIPNWTASSRLGSAMIGYGHFCSNLA